MSILSFSRIPVRDCIVFQYMCIVKPPNSVNPWPWYLSTYKLSESHPHSISDYSISIHTPKIKLNDDESSNFFIFLLTERAT
jgi:hypothetical protein